MFTWEKLQAELVNAGVPTTCKYLGQNLSPLDALINGSFSSKPYVAILLKHLATADNGKKEFIVRALTEKGNTKATKALLALFSSDATMTESQLWAVGNALYVINDKDSYKPIVEICKDKRFGSARQMLMGVLARARTEEAFQTLIICLGDPMIKGHAIEALGRFGETRAIASIEQTTVEAGLFESRAKQTALRRLRKKIKNA